MEARERVAKAVLAGAELAEVAGSLWDDVVVQAHDDVAGRLAVDLDLEVDGLAWSTDRARSRASVGRS